MSDDKHKSDLQPPIDTAVCSEAQGYRALWCAVLVEQWKIAFGQGSMVRPIDVRAAHDWFGSSPFQQVCSLAGVDSGFVMRRYREERATGKGAL